MLTLEFFPTVPSPDPSRKSLILTPFSRVLKGRSPSGTGAWVPTFVNSLGLVVVSATAASVDVNNMEDTLAKVAKTCLRSVQLIVCDFPLVSDVGVANPSTEVQAIVARKAIVYLSLMVLSKAV